MGNMPHIVVELMFLTTAEGGRRTGPPQPPWEENHCWYMPHVVAEGQSDYLGVCFIDGPATCAGELAKYELALMYHPEVDYSALQPGVSISICEGGQIVARGHVLERTEQSGHPARAV
jgi:hypothetical protein